MSTADTKRASLEQIVQGNIAGRAQQYESATHPNMVHYPVMSGCSQHLDFSSDLRTPDLAQLIGSSFRSIMNGRKIMESIESGQGIQFVTQPCQRPSS